MPQPNVQYLAFNRGLISPLALGRLDLKRTALSAEIMVNWMPRALGPMSLRPGFGYLGSTINDSTAKFIPFIFSTDDAALIELTGNGLRVWVNDAVISRPSVSSQTTNGTFSSNITGWTDADESGAVSAWATGGYMILTGTGTNAAKRYQQVSVAAGDQGVEHALEIRIARGPVTFRVGSTLGADDYITETELQTGYHSLALTPTGDFYIEFSNRLDRGVYVDYVYVDIAGAMAIVTPWPEADLGKIRWDQSADVVFVACKGYRQQRIERRAARSWSVVDYYTDNGPFRTENLGPITITPSGLSGSITLTASAPLFRSTQVGALWSITSDGQNVTENIAAQNTWTDPIRIAGVDASRIFTVIISSLTGTGTTVTLQRSLDDVGAWEDVPGKTWTADTTETYDDGLDNQIVYYRIGVATGGYAAGPVDATLQTGTGSITGIVRLIGFTSSTEVSADVLTHLGDVQATDIWAEGAWSDRRGWPTSVALYEGRLVWAGKNGLWASISDAYDSYDGEFEGDAGPISRSIGSGPVDTINWLMPMQRLIAGAEGSEIVIKSNSLDEPLTPTNFQMKSCSYQGSAAVPPVLADRQGIFVQRGGTRVLELELKSDSLDFEPRDLTQLCPEVGQPQIVRIAVQRQPDTRVHCVRSDGTVAVCVYEPVEKVLGWVEVETDGLVEDVVVLPGVEGESEDHVYYLVKRTINGLTKRYLERWATEAQCHGDTINRQADSFIVYSGAAIGFLTGLSHLEGETVVVWGNGKDLGEYTINAGQLGPLSEPVTNACIGLGYQARWKSVKLAFATESGSSLLESKRIATLGVLLHYTHYQGLRYGQSFTAMEELPLVEDWVDVAADTIHTHYDKDAFSFPSEWDTDSRLCLEANAPRPCTVLAAIMQVEA